MNFCILDAVIYISIRTELDGKKEEKKSREKKKENRKIERKRTKSICIS